MGMLAYIKGNLIGKGINYVIVENNQLGYKIFVAEKTAIEAQLHKPVEFFLYHAVREDASDLYGLQSMDELNFFEKLLTVSGIGPKTALNIFSSAKLEDLLSAIISGDAGVLKQVSGIGPKTAERMVLELKNKLAGLVGVNAKSKSELTSGAEAVEALTSLGYSTSQAREALSQVDQSITDLSTKLKEALRLLAKK